MVSPALKIIPFFAAPPAPVGPTLVHTFNFVVGGTGSRGYNAPGSFGSVAAGSSASYDTPAGTTVTIQQLRELRGDLIFVISGSGVTTSSTNEFPSRVELERAGTTITFAPPSSFSLRTAGGGIREELETTATSDQIRALMAAGTTVTARIYYS